MTKIMPTEKSKFISISKEERKGLTQLVGITSKDKGIVISLIEKVWQKDTKAKSPYTEDSIPFSGDFIEKSVRSVAFSAAQIEKLQTAFREDAGAKIVLGAVIGATQAPKDQVYDITYQTQGNQPSKFSLAKDQMKIIDSFSPQVPKAQNKKEAAFTKTAVPA